MKQLINIILNYIVGACLVAKIFLRPKRKQMSKLYKNKIKKAQHFWYLVGEFWKYRFPTIFTYTELKQIPIFGLYFWASNSKERFKLIILYFLLILLVINLWSLNYIIIHTVLFWFIIMHILCLFKEINQYFVFSICNDKFIMYFYFPIRIFTILLFMFSFNY